METTILIIKREDLMEKYAKNQIDKDFYLQRMGALSLKLARVAKKTTVDAENEEASNKAPAADESNDSLSETRAIPHSEDTDDSFSDNDHNYGTDALTGGADKLLNRKTTAAKKSKQKGKG